MCYFQLQFKQGTDQRNPAPTTSYKSHRKTVPMHWSPNPSKLFLLLQFLLLPRLYLVGEFLFWDTAQAKSPIFKHPRQIQLVPAIDSWRTTLRAWIGPVAQRGTSQANKMAKGLRKEIDPLGEKGTQSALVPVEAHCERLDSSCSGSLKWRFSSRRIDGRVADLLAYFIGSKFMLAVLRSSYATPSIELVAAKPPWRLGREASRLSWPGGCFESVGLLMVDADADADARCGPGQTDRQVKTRQTRQFSHHCTIQQHQPPSVKIDSWLTRAFWVTSVISQPQAALASCSRQG